MELLFQSSYILPEQFSHPDIMGLLTSKELLVKTACGYYVVHYERWDIDEDDRNEPGVWKVKDGSAGLSFSSDEIREWAELP